MLIARMFIPIRRRTPPHFACAYIRLAVAQLACQIHWLLHYDVTKHTSGSVPALSNNEMESQFTRSLLIERRPLDLVGVHSRWHEWIRYRERHSGSDPAQQPRQQRRRRRH